jgi:ubiquinone/menaquinone biosynthesis C-methylase UbiE
MNKQCLFRAEYKKLKPEWRESMDIYYELVDNAITSDTTVLAIGSGHSDFLKDAFAKAKSRYAVDPDETALKSNTFIENKFVAFAERLPFPDNKFDLITSEWVFEHIRDAESVMAEVARVLRPGGKLIFLTPNALNYNTWLIRLIPNKLHAWFTKKLYNRLESDTYPTKYNLNSYGKIRSLSRKRNMEVVECIFNEDPSYTSFNKVTFFVSVTVDTLFALILPKSQVHIICVLKKNE